MAENLEETIKDLALPLIEAHNLVLWGLTITPGPVLKVAIYVDKPEEDASHISASIDQCESISRQLGLALEVEDSIDQPWVLEVSSPGIERRFFSLEQMRPYIGNIIEVKLKDGQSPRKSWKGRLLAVGENAFEIQPCSLSDDGVVCPDDLPPQTLLWDNVRNAHRVFVFTAPRKPGKPHPKKTGKT